MQVDKRWQLAAELFDLPTNSMFSSYEECWDTDTVWCLPYDEEDDKSGQEVVCLVVIQIVDHTVRPFVGILHVWHLEARRLQQKVAQTPQRGKRYIHHPVVCLQQKIAWATYITNINFFFMKMSTLFKIWKWNNTTIWRKLKVIHVKVKPYFSILSNIVKYFLIAVSKWFFNRTNAWKEAFVEKRNKD